MSAKRQETYNIFCPLQLLIKMENPANTGEDDSLSPQSVGQVNTKNPSTDTGVGSDPRNGTLDRNLGVLEVLTKGQEVEFLRILYTAFQGTGDINYLDKAIGLAKGLVASAPFDEIRQCALSVLRDLQQTRDGWTGGREDLEQVIKWSKEAVTEMPLDHPDRANGLGNLSRNLFRRYERFGALEDLEESIKWAKEVVATTPPDHTGRAGRLNNLGNRICSRYNRLGDLQDLEQAIKLAEEAVAATPLGNPHRAAMLNSLGCLIGSRYDRLGDLQDLEKAIKRAEEAVAATPPDHPDHAGMLANLGDRIGSRYNRLGDLQDLEKAIKWAEEALSATLLDHPDHAGMLDSLGGLIGSRYDRLGDLQDLEQAIKCGEEALAATPLDHPDRAAILNNLGNRIGSRYDRLGGLQDLEQAIKWAEEALAATPSDYPGHARMLANLGDRIGSRYNRLGDLQDLEKAIKWVEEALVATPPDHPDHAGMLDSLGGLIGSRYDRLGDLQDLEQGIRWAEEVLAATPPDYSKRARKLNNLGNWIGRRYYRLGDLRDLEQAIKWAEEAVTTTPLDHPERATMLNNLGGRIGSRYDRLGDLQDLEQAIKLVEEAVAAIPPDHPDRAEWLNNLGGRAGSRYDRLGDLQDLEQAIKWAEEALAATPPDHPGRARRLNILGYTIGRKYDRLGDLQDLEKAIKWVEEAVAATPPNHPERVRILCNLGIRIGSRYNRLGDLGDLGDLQDLEQAIKWTKEALAETPLDYPERRSILNNLGDWIWSRYNRLGDLQDLEQAIKWAEGAVAATPPDHPGRALYLCNLADPLILRYEKTGSIQEFNYILRISYEAWHNRVSPPEILIKIARKTALFLAARKMWQESSSLLEGAVKMLPKLSPRSLQRHDQEYRLSNFSQLAAETASIAFQAGEEAAHGLRFLEFGRGIISGLVIDCRSDLSELQSKHPELFDKFHRLRIEIDSPVGTGSPLEIYPPLGGREKENHESTYRQRCHRREQVIHDLDETLTSIRELPGFEGFQLPPRSDDLMAMAGEGPIVIFNSTEFRSDAIIVTSSAIKSLALPRLLYTSVEERMGQLAKLAEGRRSTYPQRNQKMREILLWLWDVAVEPVFNALNLDTADNKLPRIWWIGVGRLATAPFHAAGDHSPGSARNTISRAISSYTPTMKALSYARQKKLELLSRTDSRLLLVTMPTTPGHDPLSNVAEEAEKVFDAVKGKAITTRLDHPSTAQVLANLPSFNIIHFACHGMSDRASPSNSHLLLRKDDGSESGTLDRLTVGTISNMDIEHAQIAYLSACSTAENASANLADESIYIGSGFQLAGFSHVLATQWKSNDDACRQVAGEFYKSLFSHQPGRDEDEEGHRKVSAAFHYAVKKLRDEMPKQPIKWAPFIHTGA